MSPAEVVPLRKRSALELHKAASTHAKNLKENYLRLFEILLEIEAERAYFEFDVPSFHLYCTELLELSPSTAKDFSIVVRKSLEVTELADAVRASRVTISKARKICSVLTKENHREWIDLAIHCSARDVERAVAQANPREAVYESLKYISGNTLELKVGVSEEWSALLHKTKDLLSKKEKRAVSTEEALFILMSDYCRKNDPVEKAKRAQKRTRTQVIDDTQNDSTITAIEPKSSKPSARTNRVTLTRHRPMSVEHEVNLRDGNRCTHIDNSGTRCKHTRWLEKHHVVEFAKGGAHSVENLRTLCSAHHSMTHRQQK